MFSSAFKTLTSNITANYDISKQSTATNGAWTIFDAKKKSTGSQASVFVFKRESLDVGSGGFGARTSATSLRRIQDEVVERLKKEASSLARLRHPSILQLVEPVEETRSGGLMFATEPVLASLSGALEQQDRKESSSNRGSADGNASRALTDIELDELEIQKGVLQVAKGLEFLHDSAKLVHGNLTPDAIFINAKSDWKISGLAFAGPPDGAEGHQPIPQISLSEVLHHDSRVPRFVQLNLDYSSPDFVLDSNINFSADMFSLGLILLACYRKPHASPIEAHGNQSTYKKICSSTSSVPNPSNNYLCSNTLPRELAQTLPRILARRPAQRMSANEFQQSEYFNNILVNTIRFLDALPAKTPAEKSQFMRGLPGVLSQFPPKVLSKKVLTALLDEMKDRDLLASILQNVFKIIQVVPDSQIAVSSKVLPQMREIFLTKSKSEERDTSKEAGLLMVLENVKLLADNCSAKQFKDDVLPIIHAAMESSTHSLTDAALQTVSVILPLLDFSTVKHDLFPVVASVFAKTSSLSIKVRGLEALGILCGVSSTQSSRPEDFLGTAKIEDREKNTSSLDKFTMQEKIVPLLKGIKTKEPAVMMAALKVLKQVGQMADTDFLAMEVMPILWTFALGPLLDLAQFKSFMDVIRSLSSKVEREQIRKLQGLGASRSDAGGASSAAPVSNGTVSGRPMSPEEDFEKLVLGNKIGGRDDLFEGALSEPQRLVQNPPTFSWSTVSASSNLNQAHKSSSQGGVSQPQPGSRSITPDVNMSSFPSLQPASSTAASLWAASTPHNSTFDRARPQQQPDYSTLPVTTSNSSSNVRLSQPAALNSPPLLPPPPFGNLPKTVAQQPTQKTSFQPATFAAQPVLKPKSSNQSTSTAPTQTQKSGLDKYQSLL